MSAAAWERVRHDRIESVVESTTLRCMYELHTEHDFTSAPREIEVASVESLLAGFVGKSARWMSA